MRHTGRRRRERFIAYGANCELEPQVLLSGDLGYIKGEDKDA